MTEEKADQIIRCVKECWWRVLLVIAIPVFLIALLLRGWPVVLTLEDGLAAWVQAVGSVMAIVVALYIATRQVARERIVMKNQAKMELFKQSSQIAQLQDALQQACDGYDYLHNSLEELQRNGEVAIDQNRYFGKDLSEVIKVYQLINWECFLLAVPEKNEELKELLSGFHIISNLGDTRQNNVSEGVKNKVRTILFNLQSLTEGDRFISLTNT